MIVFSLSERTSKSDLTNQGIIGSNRESLHPILLGRMMEKRPGRKCVPSSTLTSKNGGSITDGRAMGYNWFSKKTSLGVRPQKKSRNFGAGEGKENNLGLIDLTAVLHMKLNTAVRPSRPLRSALHLIGSTIRPLCPSNRHEGCRFLVERRRFVHNHKTIASESSRADMI